MPATPTMTATDFLATVPSWLLWAAAVAVAAFLAVGRVVLDRLRRGLPVIPQAPIRPVPWDGNDVALIVLAYLSCAMLAATSLRREHGLEATLGAHAMVNISVALIAIGWLSARGATLADLGLAPIDWRRHLGLALAGWAFVLAPLLATAAALNAIVAYDHPVVSLLGGDRDFRVVMIVIVAAVVAAPFAEELFFRRILQGWLESRLPGDGWASILLSAAVFALAHVGQGLAFVPLFPLGVVLGFIARRTGSIIPCILLHALFNAVSVGLLLADSGQAAAPPAG